MAGSKTRFGFRGGGEEPPDGGESASARTIIGHDIHLQQVPSGFEQPRPSPTPIPSARLPYTLPYTPVQPAAILAPMPETITESVPVRRRYNPQKSRLARILGRWSTGGTFHSSSRLTQPARLDETDDGADDGALEVPRDTTGRNVLLVLVIAGLTFLVTFALVRIRQRYVPAQPTAAVQVVAQPAPLPALPAPTAPPALPVAPALPAPAEKPALLGAPVAAPAPRENPRPHKPARTALPSAQPPEHLKGEILPLSP
jgi:hypothetical protein